MVELRPHPDVVGKRLGDEFVLVQLRTNMIYTLNRTAAHVWELLEAGHDRESVEQRMLARFDVDEERLRRELDELIDALLANALVTDGRT